MTPLETLKYFVKERESIRLKREQGLPAPWTDDEILQKYRFCNVRRSDDRVSHWLRDNVLTQKNIDYDLKSFLLFSALCRWINWPPTIQALLDEGFYPKKRLDFKRIGKFLDARGKKGKTWTGAYMIRAPRKGGKKGRFVAEVIIGQSLKGVLPDLVGDFGRVRSYQNTWAILQSANNHGSFMAGQIAGDWTYTSLLSDADDLRTWAPMGPGSVRGFNRLIGIKPLSKRPSEDKWAEMLNDWRGIINFALSVDTRPAAALTALDAQNCLCEYDKYARVKNGEGRPRANYQPHTY